jgi:hypothetical protein
MKGKFLSSPEENETLSYLKSELEKLKYDYSLLLQERNRTMGEFSSLGEALADCQRKRVELESALKRIKDSELSPEQGDATATRLKFLEQEVQSLSKMNDTLESLLFRSVTQEPGIKEKAREFFLKEGSLTYRVMLLITEKGSISFSEIARVTGLDQSTLNQVIEILANQRSIEVHGSSLTVPGALRLPDVETWRRIPIERVFDEVEKYCEPGRNPELVAQALQELKDEIEVKVKIRGTIIFEISKEIQMWKRGIGNQQELRFKLRDWKLRTQQ